MSTSSASARKKGLLAVAYHEAGHAMADFRLGFKIKHVSVLPDVVSAGRTRSNLGLNLRSLAFDTPSAAALARCHEKVISLLAGREAQRRFRPQSVRSHMAENDRKSAVDILWRIHPERKEMRAALKYLEARTRNLIRDCKNWRLIEDLAGALVESGSLDGQEVRRIFVQSVQNQIKERRRR